MGHSLWPGRDQWEGQSLASGINGVKLPDGVETPMERRKGMLAQLSLHNVPHFPSSQYL